MRQGFRYFAGAAAVSLAIHVLTPRRGAYRISDWYAPFIVAAIGAAVLLAGSLVGHLIDRRASSIREAGSQSLFSRRVLIILAALLASELIVTRLLSSLVESVLLVECAYFVALFVAGAALARWCASRAYVAPLAAATVLAVLTAAAFVRFVTAAGPTARYGPERWLFAVQDLSGHLAMLPLDVAVAYIGWHLFVPRGRAAAPAAASGSDSGDEGPRLA